MTITVFYSWQSDLPSNVTRDFIREALDTAVVEINRGLEIEEAVRVTSDTQDEPGHPAIFDTILRKIETCNVFVPDVSLVDTIASESRRNIKGLLNSNVAIEYGYALNALGQQHLIPVMNTAFGGLGKLPFDMAHRRAPIRFHLPANAGSELRLIEKTKLAEELAHALQVMLSHDLLLNEDMNSSRDAESFEPVVPLSGDGANEFPARVLGQIDWDNPFNEGDVRVWLRGESTGPQIFLRVVPPNSSSEYAALDLRDMIKAYQIQDLMGYKTPGAFYHARNVQGAAAFTVDAENKHPDTAFAFGVTQVFTNGEIWGVDSWLLDPDRAKLEGDRRIHYVPSHTFEEAMMTALSQYLLLARDGLKHSVPLRWIAGLRGINGYRLAVNSNFRGPALNSNCIFSGIVDDYQTPIHESLKPFFEKIWAEFGERRPLEQSKMWEKAQGFDLEPTR